jgi:outer membrane protein
VQIESAQGKMAKIICVVSSMINFLGTKPQIAVALCLATLLFPVTSKGQTLTELWERLAISEPTLLAAVAQARATKERTNQTNAQFFPKISATANTTANKREYQTTGATPSTTDEKYNSNGPQLNLTQPIWKSANTIAHRQALVASDQAVHQMLAVQHDLLGKLVSAWAEDLYARDALQAAIAIEAASSRQLLLYERGFKLGLYSVSERDDAQAKNQQAIAERYSAESEVFVRRTALEQLVGPLPVKEEQHINLQIQRIPFATLKPLATFTVSIDDYNPSIKAAERAVRVAQEEVRKLKAQYEPTLELVASLGRTSQGAGSTPNQSGYKNNLRTIGLQLNIPLYSGGETASKVAEAILLENKARHELDAAKRQALSQAGQAWAQLRAAQAKLEVSEIALTAGLSAERLAQAGIRTGTKTLLDELQAKKQVESAVRDGKRAYYDNVIGMSKLMAATGLIEEDTLRDIQERLKNPLPFAKIPGIEFSTPEN